MYIYLRRLIFLEREKVRTPQHNTPPSSRSAPEYILHPWSLNFDTFISALKIFSEVSNVIVCRMSFRNIILCINGWCIRVVCLLYFQINVSRKNEIIKTGLKRRISYSINNIKYIHVILKPKQEIIVKWAHFFLNFQ